MATPTVRQSARNGSIAQRLRSDGSETTIDIDVSSTNNWDNQAGVAEINTGDSAEWFAFTSIATGATANGVTRQTLTGLRGLKKNATSLTDTDSTIKKNHAIGTAIKVVHHSAEIDKLVQNDADNTITGDNTLSGNNYFQSTANGTLRMQNVTTAERTALTGIANGHMVYDTDLGEFYAYQGGAWSAVSSGSTQPNASTTVAGKVEEATDAELGAGTTAGGTGAQLFINPGSAVKTSSGAGDENKIAVLNSSGQFADGFIKADVTTTKEAQGRLTFTTGVPVQIASGAAYTTVYYTPYIGDQIALYDGSNWGYHTFTERSLSLSGFTADSNYDIFIYDNAGTLTLEELIWTNDTTRATALVRQDGVLCKTGALTRRYLGTLRTTGTTGQSAWQPESTPARLLLWNMYNRVNAHAQFSSSSGGSGSVSIRSYNNNSGNTIQFVCGVQEDAFNMYTQSFVSKAAANGGPSFTLGIGVDTTSSNTESYQFSDSNIYGATNVINVPYSDTIAAGEHELFITETGTVSTIGANWSQMRTKFNFMM